MDMYMSIGKSCSHSGGPPLIFPTTYNGIRTKNRPGWITPGAAPIRWMGPIRNPRWEQKRTEGYVIVSRDRLLFSLFLSKLVVGIFLSKTFSILSRPLIMFKLFSVILNLSFCKAPVFCMAIWKDMSTERQIELDFLFTNLFSIKFLYFFIISSLFPYFNLFVSIFIQSYVNIKLHVSTLYRYSLIKGDDRKVNNNKEKVHKVSFESAIKCHS
jgi:hypothetical protein